MFLRAWNTLSESAGKRWVASAVAGLFLGLQSVGFIFFYSRSLAHNFYDMYDASAYHPIVLFASTYGG